MRNLQIGVLGSMADLSYSKECEQAAEKLGELIAERHGILLFGAEKDADVIIPCGLERGGGREMVLALACDAVISISGGSGTLNELVIAYQADIPMIALTGFGGWSDKLAGQYFDERKRRKVLKASTPEEAVEMAFAEALRNWP